MDRKIYMLGAMTGTSGDGLDICILSFDFESKARWSYIADHSFPFPPSLAKSVLSFQERDTLNKKELIQFVYKLGAFTGERIRELIGTTLSRKVLPRTAVAYHGQTIAHYPGYRKPGREISSSMTYQAGESSIISALTGLTVVSDFRQADVAAGGQGAPLAPLFHSFLLGRSRVPVAFLNLGGISNVTVVSKGAVLIASDTGPGNMLIDGAVRKFSSGRKRFDRGGTIALKGTVSKSLFSYLEKRDSFLRKRKPASTGREHYGEGFLERVLSFKEKEGLSEEDTIATLTDYTAQCVGKFIKKYAPAGTREIYIAGGGVKNVAMTAALSRILSPISIRDSSCLGIGPEYIEAAAFSYLGYLCLKGSRVDTSSFAGGGKTVLGKITPGENFGKIMKLIYGK